MNKTDTLQPLLRAVIEEAIVTLAGYADRRSDGERQGQYGLDLVVDGPLVERLVDAGLGVVSEETGVVESHRSLIAVVDPVDGSTNASRGIPWFNTSICIVDDQGPLISIVENHVTRERFEAVRGEGANRNGRRLQPAPITPLLSSVVAVNGVPPRDGPWAQFRTFGASALDLSYVAMGALDAYVDFAEEAHGVWDYLGAHLICSELKVHMVDAFGRDLVHLDHTARRTPVAAADRETLDQLIELRRSV